MNRWPAIRNASEYALAVRAFVGPLCVALVCSGCGNGGEPEMSSGTPPAGAVSSPYNIGDGTTCAPSTTACMPCYLGGSIRACPVNWRYQNSYALTATDGLPPYFWTATSLPPGITVSSDGAVAGTPTTAGTFTASVTVTDSSFPAERITDSVTFVIDSPLGPTIATAPAPAKGALNRPYTNVFVAIDGLLPLTWSAAGVLPPGLDFTDGGTLSGTPTVIGQFAITLMVQDAGGQSAIPRDASIDILSHGFSPTGPMATPRTLHTATMLVDGRVLVAGGFDGASGSSTAEFYDPAGGVFIFAADLTLGRYDHSATLLDNGSVLLAGGLSDPVAAPIATAQLFLPASGGFTTTGALVIARHSHTATLLDDGTVLITGGVGSTAAPLRSAEIYDPSTGRFVAVGTMTVARAGHTATVLNTGEVLIVGGFEDVEGTALQSAEIYDPARRRFTATGSMNDARAHQAAALLSNGEVLVAGGIADNATASAETYDSATGTFSLVGNMRTAHSAPKAALLSDGGVLVTGAGDDQSHLIADAEVYDALSATFLPTGSMTTARDGHTATLLENGQVLVTGGSNGAVLATAELYQ